MGGVSTAGDKEVHTVSTRPSISILIYSMLLPAILLALFHLTSHSHQKRAHSGLAPPGTLDLARISAHPIGRFLSLFMQPRTPGSHNSRMIQIFLLQHFEKLGWAGVEVDRFRAGVPPEGKELVFTNLVFTLNPKAKKQLVLAAHYDSKAHVDGQKAQEQFIGATDSAWPCALLVELAYALTPRLLKSPKFVDVSLQIIFFDGEEAQVHWGPDDSIYGAKHLAAKWSKEEPEKIARIELFVLLDLLGAANPGFYPIIRQTRSQYQRLMQAEDHVNKTVGLSSTKGISRYFSPSVPMSAQGILVEDDHTPFHTLGIPVLHVIPLPFPAVWHTMKDDESALDNGTIRDLTMIMVRYLNDYFQLPEYVPVNVGGNIESVELASEL